MKKIILSLFVLVFLLVLAGVVSFVSAVCPSDKPADSPCQTNADCAFLSQTEVTETFPDPHEPSGYRTSTSCIPDPEAPIYYCGQESCGEANKCIETTTCDTQNTNSCGQGKVCLNGLCVSCAPQCTETCPAGEVLVECTDMDGGCEVKMCKSDRDGDGFAGEMPGHMQSCTTLFDCDDDSSNDATEYTIRDSKYIFNDISENAQNAQIDPDGDGNIAEHVYPGAQQLYFDEIAAYINRDPVRPQIEPSALRAVPKPNTNCNEPPEVTEAGIQINPKLIEKYPIKKAYSEEGLLLEGDEVICSATIKDPDEPVQGSISAYIFFIQGWYYENEVGQYIKKESTQFQFRKCTYKPELQAWYCEDNFRVTKNDAIAYCYVVPIDSKGELNTPKNSNSFQVPKYHDFFFYVDPNSVNVFQNSNMESGWQFLMDKTLMNEQGPPFLAMRLHLTMGKFNLEKYKFGIESILELKFRCRNYYNTNAIAIDLEKELEKYGFGNFNPGKDRIVIISDEVIKQFNYCYRQENTVAFANNWYIVSMAVIPQDAYTHERLHTGSIYDLTIGLVDEYEKAKHEEQGGGPNPFPDCCVNDGSTENCGTWTNCNGFPYLDSDTKDDASLDNPPYGPMFSIMSSAGKIFSIVAIPCETGIPYRDPITWTQNGGTCERKTSGSSITGQAISGSEIQIEQVEIINKTDYIDESFVVNLILFPDGKAKIESVNVDDLIPSNNFYLNEADEHVWLIKLLSESKEELSSAKISAGFYLYDVDIELPESLEYIKLPYSADARFIEIYYHENKVAEAEINNEKFCNNDNVCNNFESYSSCSDCKESDLDGVCSQVYNQTNGICDPDCLDDPDCPQQSTKIADLNQDGQISFIELFSALKKFDKQEINSAQILRAIREWLSS